ncbi:alpha-hydroxy acid oxidase [Luedemannella helvata]|uniref:Alpha-hydroxy acid oxidase n=1 Tax=Luedemannella helvata TaxID=349315 RepID=A0ABP4VZP6_9ACTN
MTVIRTDDYGRVARERLPADVWDFIEGGSGDELTLAANAAAFRRARLRPRVMVDVSTVDTTRTLLGSRLATPIGIAPTAYHQLVHPDGEVATAAGADRAGALFVVAMFASRTLKDIAAASAAPLWLQLYWLRRRDAIADLAERAADAGFAALVLTADAPRLGRRLRDVRNGFAVDGRVRAVNLDAALMAASHDRRAGASALAAHAAQTFDPSLTWADLAWLRERSALPVLIKGILTGEDAAAAVAHGAAGIIVSNHGGRQLDGAIAALDALPEVVDAVAGACPVLFDGAVRGGRDALVALALGADAVLVGRPPLWALAAGGADGVADLLTGLTDELAHDMALAGRPTLADVDRRLIWGHS